MASLGSSSIIGKVIPAAARVASSISLFRFKLSGRPVVRA
jgi:hypothetical protein